MYSISILQECITSYLVLVLCKNVLLLTYYFLLSISTLQECNT